MMNRLNTRNFELISGRQTLVLALLVGLSLLCVIPWLKFLSQFRLDHDGLQSTAEAMPTEQLESGNRHVDQNEPHIAWLASFPNSGTSFTLQVIRKSARVRVATNYASLRADRLGSTMSSSPVFIDQPSGPFWSDAESDMYHDPTSYVLTKTHCGAPCVDCPPEKYLRMMHEFRILCFTGEQLLVENGTRTIRHVMYPPSRVRKVIHLYRSPIDNVVARFRYETNNNRSAAGYPRTREGFRAYCNHVNKKYARAEVDGRFLNKPLWSLLRNVPCRMEFFRYVEWHNLAAATFSDMGLEVMPLHYDSYETQFNRTVNGLLDFLELRHEAEPVPFISGKSYHDYFTGTEHEAIASSIHALALDAVWKQISGYIREV